MKKRIISLLMCVVMLVTLLPTAAWAQEAQTDPGTANGSGDGAPSAAYDTGDTDPTQEDDADPDAVSGGGETPSPGSSTGDTDPKQEGGTDPDAVSGGNETPSPQNADVGSGETGVEPGDAACQHKYYYGICTKCGYVCPHNGETEQRSVRELYCTLCDNQLCAKVEITGSEGVSYFSLLPAAFRAVPNGASATITLVGDSYLFGYDYQSKYTVDDDVYIHDGQVIELDMGDGGYRGYSVNRAGHSGNIYIGRDSNQAESAGTLRIKSAKNEYSSIHANLFVCSQGELDLTSFPDGTIDLVEVIGSGKLPSPADNCRVAKLLLNGIGKAKNITLTNGYFSAIEKDDADTGGEYSIGDLLADGYVWYSSNDRAYLPFDTTTPLGSGRVEPCPHDIAFGNDSTCPCGKESFVAKITNPNSSGAFCFSAATNLRVLPNFVKDNGTVTLLDDIDLGNNGYWTFNSDNVTIDLNGHTLTGDNTTSEGVLYLTGDSATVKNGTVVTRNSAYNASYAIFMQTGNFTLENVTTKTAPSVGELQTVKVLGHVTIKSGSYQGLRLGVGSSAELHDGARFTPGADNKAEGAPKFSIIRGVYVHPGKSASCMDLLAPNCAYVRDNGQSLFSHGSINEAVTVKANTASPAVPVAQILRGSEPLSFITLDDAIAAVQDGETIQLLSDLDLGTGRAWVNVGRRFTLDLNGKTLSSGSGDVICMGDTASVDLTIQNGFIKGVIHVSNLNATVTLDGITATNGDDYSIVVPGGKVNIRSGDYTGVWLESVNNGEKELYGQLLLTGGTFRKPNHPDRYALYNDGMESPILTDFLGDGCFFWEGDTTNILKLTQHSTVDVVTVHPCQHSWGTDGKCSICGVDCSHTAPNSEGNCDNACGRPIVAQVTAEGTETSYHVALSQALEAAARVGGTATMLRPGTLEDEYSFPVGTYTLDMNGQPLNLYQAGDTIRDLDFPEGANVTIRSSTGAVLDSRLMIFGGDLTLSGPITLCANLPSTDDYGCRLDYMSGDGSIYSSSLTLTKTEGSSLGPTLNCNVFVSGLSQSHFFGTLTVKAGTINKNVSVSAGHLDVLSDDVEFGPNSEVTLRSNAILTATGGSFRGKVYFDYYSHPWYGTSFGKGNISGGEFANISCHENLSLATDKLAAGHVFANQSDGSLITVDGSTRQLSNVKVVPCSHEPFDSATGRCPCGQQLYVAALATYSNGQYTPYKYCATFEEAAAAPVTSNNVYILLLDDVTLTQDTTISTWVMLQGHTLTVNATLTTSGRGTLKGSYAHQTSTVNGTGQVIIGQSSDVGITDNINLEVPVTVYGNLSCNGEGHSTGFKSLTMKGGKLELFNASIGQLIIESGSVMVYDTPGSVPNGTFRDVQVKGGSLTISADRSDTVVNRFGSITASGGTVNFGAGILNGASLTADGTGVINLNGGSRADMNNVTMTASGNGVINVDSGEFKGVTSASGNVTIRGGTFVELQNQDNAPAVSLLANGYCFRRSDNSWVPSTEEAATLQNVTATTAPLTNVTAKATPDTIAYGDASPVLSVGFSAAGAVTCQWYQGDTAIEGATASSYRLPDKLNVGQYTYHVALTTEGCTVISNDVTVTVNKATPTVTAPTPIQGLTFSGSAESLVYEGSTTGGTMLYSLSQAGPYTAAVPVGTDAGTYSVWYKVEGNSNYNDAAPASVEVTIHARTIDSDDVEARTENSLAYTGKALTPVPTAVYKGQTLECGKDFTVAYANNTAVGTATVTLTGIGNFHFTKTLTFAITPATITSVSVAQKGSLTYTGTPQSAQAAASADTVDGCAVTFTYSTARGGSYSAMPAFTDVGSYTVFYKAEAPNHEAVIDSFTVAIQPRNITGATITLGDDLTYNGKAQTQTVKSVVVDGITLPARDYTVTGNSATDAGKTYTLTVSDANGNLTGTASAPWSIARKDIAGAVITLGDALTYNGKEQAQAVKSVVIDSLFATFDVVNNTGTDAGEDYTLTVSGTGNFTGTATATFSIARKDIAGAVITLGDALTYNGKEQAQTVKSVLIDGLSATFDVANNTGTDAGKEYTLTVSGTGNFTGTATAAFSIARKDIEGAAVTLGDALTYNGKEQTQTVKSVVIDGLSATFEVQNNTGTDAGEDYTLTVSGTGNFTGTASAAFSIARKDIKGAVITLGDALTYNGTEQTQSVRSVVIDGLSATFDVVNNTGTDAGEDYTLTVSGTGNFTGTASAAFSIARKDISDAVIAVTLGDVLVYNGRTQTQTVSAVAADGLTIPEGTYTVTGNTGKEAGRYTMTITADSGNFTGAATAPFPVNKAVVEPQDTALSVVNGYARDYTVDLAALLPGLKALERYGAITYGAPVVALDSGYYVGGADISASGLLTLPIARNDASTDGAVGTVTVTVSSDNFEDFDLTIRVSAENKTIPTGAPKLSRNWLRCGESLSAIRLSGTMQDGMNTVRGTFQWAEPHFTPTSDTVTAEWVFIPRDTERYASVTGTAVVTVKELPEDIHTVLGTVVYTEGTGKEPIAPVIGANVTIQIGSRIFSRTTTDENGNFSLAGVPSGEYNVVVTVNTMPRKTVTAKLTVTTGAGQQVSMDTIRVRTEDVNSRLSISGGALDVVVGGLDQLAEKRFDSDGAITDLTVDMTVEKPANDRGDALQNALRTALRGKTLELLELGLTLTSGGSTTALTQLAEDEALELIIPYDTSRRSIVVYRAALDDQGNAAVTEAAVQIDTVSGCLRLALDQPGLYAIGYKARTASGGSSDTNQTGTADAAKDGVKSADTGDNGVVLYAVLAFITPLGGVKLLRGKRRHEDD